MMGNRERHYQFPPYLDMIGPYRDFLAANFIEPSQVPWGSRFVVTDEDDLLIEMFVRDDRGYRIVNGQTYERTVERMHLVKPPELFGIKSSGDGSLGGRPGVPRPPRRPDDNNPGDAAPVPARV